LRFLELAFGITHTLTLGSVELWVYGQQRLKPERSEYYGQAHFITGLFPSGCSRAPSTSYVPGRS
jgi:hypothetical protein